MKLNGSTVKLKALEVSKLEFKNAVTVTSEYGIKFKSVWGEPIKSSFVGQDKNAQIFEFNEGISIVVFSSFEDLEYMESLLISNLSQSSRTLLDTDNDEIFFFKESILSSHALKTIFSIGNRHSLNVELLMLKHLTTFVETNKGLYSISTDNNRGFIHGQMGDYKVVLEVLLDEKWYTFWLRGNIPQPEINFLIDSLTTNP